MTPVVILGASIGMVSLVTLYAVSRKKPKREKEDGGDSGINWGGDHFSSGSDSMDSFSSGAGDGGGDGGGGD